MIDPALGPSMLQAMSTWIPLMKSDFNAVNLDRHMSCSVQTDLSGACVLLAYQQMNYYSPALVCLSPLYGNL